MKEGRDVNLNAIKRDVRSCRISVSVMYYARIARCTRLECSFGLQASSRYCLAKAPKLVEIMNAVPEEFKSILIPQYAPAEPSA